jgi:hypothetical protein
MATAKELQQYLAKRIYEEHDQIAPELADLICGDSFEEIDASVAKAIRATSSILASVTGSAQQFTQSVREGWSGGAPQTDAELAQMIHAMPLDQWQQYRATLGLK